MSSFFINQTTLIFRSFLLGDSWGLHAMVGTWVSISSLPRTPLPRHSSLLWKLTISSGRFQGDAHDLLCLHDLQIFLSFISIPTLVQRNLLVKEGMLLSRSCIFSQATQLLPPCYFASFLPPLQNTCDFLKVWVWETKSQPSSGFKVLQHSSPEANAEQRSLCLEGKEGKEAQ